MKRYLFIYREDREAYVDPDFGWVDLVVLVEKEFPAHTTDWEVLETAHAHEVKDLHEDHNTCSEGVLNRVLDAGITPADYWAHATPPTSLPDHIDALLTLYRKTS